MGFNRWEKVQPHEDAEWEAEYELAYFALSIGAVLPLDYVAQMSMKQRSAWVKAFNTLAKERGQA